MPRVDLDVAAAYQWYEHEQPGLGGQFLDELLAAYDRIAVRPLQYQDLRSGIRRAQLTARLRPVLVRRPGALVHLGKRMIAPAALASAVEEALAAAGWSISELPMTPERLATLVEVAQGR